MRRRGNRGRQLNEAEYLEIQRRVLEGETFAGAAAAVGCCSKSVQRFMARTGGIRANGRERSPWRLSLAEREELSRGLLSGESLRRIATRLGRAPSTISREVCVNGHRDAYRAWQAEETCTKRARRPSPPIPFRSCDSKTRRSVYAAGGAGAEPPTRTPSTSRSVRGILFASVSLWVTTTAVMPQPLVHLEEQLVNPLPGRGVEVAGGLVGEQQPWLQHQRPGQRHPLLLAARQLAGLVVQPLAEPDGLEHLARPRLGLAPRQPLRPAPAWPRSAAP